MRVTMKKGITLGFIVSVLFFSCEQSNNKVKYYEVGLNSPTQSKEAANFYSMGYAEFTIGNYYGAIDFYKKAVSCDTKFTDAIDNLALSYRKIGNLDSAEKYYKYSLTILYKNELAWNNLALVYIFKNDFEKAKTTFRKLISINNKYGDAYYGMSEVFLHQQNGDSTVYFGLKAYELWKNNDKEFAGDALNYVVQGYLLLKDRNKAKEYYALGKQLGEQFSNEIERDLIH